MQNTSYGTKSPAQQLHTIADTLHNSAELGSGIQAKAKHMAGDTADVAADYYDTASTWMEQNYGKTLGIISMIAVAGVIGYYLGRNNNGVTTPN